MGTSSSPVVNVVNGDVSISGSGAGALLVTGQLTLNGNFSWNGLILAIGEGAILKAGGGSATLNASTFPANLYSDIPNPTTGPGAYPAYSHPIALLPSHPPHIPSFP